MTEEQTGYIAHRQAGKSRTAAGQGMLPQHQQGVKISMAE